MRLLRLRDYLRVCGADLRRAGPVFAGQGLPPRVRSRLVDGQIGDGSRGITSACAEQTDWAAACSCWARDYLRVCGADLLDGFNIDAVQGLPPRVRSRQLHMRLAACGAGITSACAEQTSTSPAILTSRWDYLRVCGADLGISVYDTQGHGLPPRVRSRRFLRSLRPVSTGITSACAEQTSG